MARGAVYFHPQLRFHDNEIGEKRLIIMNEPRDEEPYIVVKTTTNLRNRTFTESCNPAQKVFFLKGQINSPLPLDALIQLFEFYEFSKVEILAASLHDKILEYIGDLAPIAFAQLINCVKRLKNDIPQEYFAMITRR